MNSYQASVLQFMRAMGQHAPAAPTLKGYPYELRAKLILEEALEFVEAAGLKICIPTAYGKAILTDESYSIITGANKNAVDMVDAICDLLYVVYGAAVAMGLDLDPFFKRVHASNMSKLWEDGKPRFNAYGKVIKPPTWQPPKLEELLLEYLTDT